MVIKHKQVYGTFVREHALCDEDLELYASIVGRMARGDELSKEDANSLQALEYQGIHYVNTREVKYKVNGWFLDEGELVGKVRVLIGQQLGLPESQTTKLVQIVRRVEQQYPLCRVDTQSLENIFEQAGKNRGSSAYEQFRKPIGF